MKIFACLLLVLSVFPPFAAVAAGPASIAVAAEGEVPSSQVSAVAARGRYFLLFDVQGALVEALENPYRDAAGGAGTRAVALLAAKGVSVVVAGAFGSKMTGAMETRKMRFLEFRGAAADAVAKALTLE